MGKKSISEVPRGLSGHVCLVFSVMFIALLFLPTSLLPQNPELEAKLEIQDTLDHGKVVNMRFTFQNHTDEEIIVLSWFTPFEGIAGEIFDIKHDGKAVSYHGILVKRGDPLAEDYITIAAGGTLSTEIDLAESYDFSKAGDYDIEFRSPKVTHMVKEKSLMAKSLTDLRKVRGIMIPANKVKVKILQPSELRAAPVMADEAEAAKKTYDNCTPDKMKIVSDADAKASRIAGEIPGCLKELTSSEKKQYETWFGTFDQTRFDEVVDHFKKIGKAFSEGNITYNCNGPMCKNSWYAYVYKGGKVEVFLCPQFWNAEETGTDTKFGVLIHEVSHEVADTDDYVYGVPGCKNLAKTDPDKAVDNADNHEYFSEVFTCSGANYLLYSLLVIFVILFAEGWRRFRKSKTSAPFFKKKL